MGKLEGLLAKHGAIDWYDMQVQDLTAGGMEQGVSESRNFLLFLSHDYVSAQRLSIACLVFLPCLRWTRVCVCVLPRADGPAVLPEGTALGEAVRLPDRRRNGEGQPPRCGRLR